MFSKNRPLPFLGKCVFLRQIQCQNMINYGLKDRVALITGANNPQGIGAATAFAFAREGAKVVLVYKKVPRSSAFAMRKP